MPFLLIGFVIAVGLFLLLKWWANAPTQKAKSSLAGVLMALLIAIGAVLVFGVLKGNAGLIPVLIAVAIAIFKIKRGAMASSFGGIKSTSTSMTRDEALDVLGLDGDPSREEVQAAYKKLMAKSHPDHGGTDWMAAKLNEARQTLLND